MPRNLHYYRKECEKLLARYIPDDPHAEDIFSAAIEQAWNDQVSLEEIAEEMRNDLRLHSIQ